MDQKSNFLVLVVRLSGKKIKLSFSEDFLIESPLKGIIHYYFFIYINLSVARKIDTSF